MTRLRNIALFLAYAVATIPLWHYIRDGRILALMTVVIVFAYFNVVLTTVQAAQPILSSEKAKTALPRWLPDKPKYQKWWLLVRRTLKWHLLLIPPKLGLALGFTQRLFVYGLSVPFGQVYNYWGYNIHPDSLPAVYPQWETIALTTVILVAFALLDAALIASICLMTKQHFSLKRQVLLVIGMRILISLSAIGIGIMIQQIDSHTYRYYRRHAPCYLVPLYENGEPVYEDEYPLVYVLTVADKRLCRERRVFETVYTTLMTPFDQSVLLSANIMRPLSKLSYAERGYPSSYPEVGARRWDSRPFVARQLVAGLLGLLLYAGATWVILWFVEDTPALE